MPTRVDMTILQGRQQRLRDKPTPWESQFKSRLQERRIGFQFQEIIAPYIVDFAFPEKMLVLELDGDHHTENPETVEYDARRTAYLKRLGFDVWRVANSDASSFQLEKIECYVNNLCSDYAEAVQRACKRYQPSTRPAKPRKKTLKRLSAPQACGVCQKTFLTTKKGKIQRHRAAGGDWCGGSPVPASYTAVCVVCKQGCKPRPSGKCPRCRKVLGLVKNNTEILNCLLVYTESLKKHNEFMKQRNQSPNAPKR